MTDPLLTSSAKSYRNFLAARERRQEILAQHLSPGTPATLFLSLNIPGGDKTPAGSEALFDGMLEALSATFPELLRLDQATDLLGPYAIMALERDPLDVKNRCIALETSQPSARLVDLDVYSGAGLQIDRSRLGLPARPCLVCPHPAVECIRLKRHALDEVMAKTHELLAPFRT